MLTLITHHAPLFWLSGAATWDAPSPCSSFAAGRSSWPGVSSSAGREWGKLLTAHVCMHDAASHEGLLSFFLGDQRLLPCSIQSNKRLK